MKRLLILIVLTPFLSLAQTDRERTINFPKQTLFVDTIPAKEKLWVFIMAGQSNMAGRGFVEPQDTIPDMRVLSINKENQLIIAKEPLHFYQPKLTGLDCGVSFAHHLKNHLDKNISIMIIPCAVGGSSVDFWLNDSIFNAVHLKSNFIEKIELAKKYGTLKGILWHQGESDAYEDKIPTYGTKLQKLFAFFRQQAEIDTLPIFIGELGSYPVSEKMKSNWKSINEIIHKEVTNDRHCYLIETGDLTPKDDNIHFDAPSQRKLGQRYTEAYLKLLKSEH